MSRAVGETIGGKFRLPTTSEAGSPAANRQPYSAALLTSGRNAIRTSAVSTMFNISLIATHQYRTRPYLVPSPRTTPLARQTRPAVSSGQTANSSSARKQSALVLSSSARRARKITTQVRPGASRTRRYKPHPQRLQPRSTQHRRHRRRCYGRRLGLDAWCQIGVKRPQRPRRGFSLFAVFGLYMRNYEARSAGLEPATF